MYLSLAMLYSMNTADNLDPLWAVPTPLILAIWASL